MKKVYIVTGVSLGWDCIVAVFDTDKVSLANIRETFPETQEFMIFEREVEESLEAWQIV